MTLSADPSGRFCFQAWPEGVVVFDRATGDTHALDPLSSLLFLKRGEIRHNRQSLPAYLRAHHPELAMPDDDTALQSAISALESLGLWSDDAS